MRELISKEIKDDKCIKTYVEWIVFDYNDCLIYIYEEEEEKKGVDKYEYGF